MINALVLYNPQAGRVPLSEIRLSELLDRLHGHGIISTSMMTPSSGHPLNWLDLQDKDMMIVYGGDGTFQQVLPEALRWNIPVGLLPGGTANVLARELGIPRDSEEAMRVLSRRKLRNIHIARANGRYFHLMAGVGLDAFVVSQLKEHIKRAMGIGAYWLTAAVALMRYPFQPFQLSLDGETHEGTSVVIANARNYGGRLLVTPRASVDEKCLDVCLFTSRFRWRYLCYLWGTFTGDHVDYPDVIYRKVGRVRISNGVIPIQLDGEAAGYTPMEFSSIDETVEVLVP
jgi:diacylglycerol kinase (ATP)